MLTLTFLGTWAKATVLTVLAVVIERATLTSFWVFTPVAAVTLLVYLMVCVGLFHEWRTQAGGYRRHELTGHRRDRV